MRSTVVAMLSGMLVSCAAVNQLNLLSTADEVAIGRQAAAEVEKEVAILDDPVVLAYVDSLGQVLARHSKRPNLTYHFKVVDTDDMNAFALPGGWLYVNRGLIAAAANESELAGVVGHEIAHVVARHGARQISKQFGLAMLVQLAVGDDPSLAREIAGQFAQMGAWLTLLKYGRDAEREADYLAVQETHAAGVDPEGVATFFEKLLALHEAEPEGAAVWFSTHPPSWERIANVRSQIAKLPARSGLRKDSERFQTIKARVGARRKTEDRPKRPAPEGRRRRR